MMKEYEIGIDYASKKDFTVNVNINIANESNAKQLAKEISEHIKNQSRMNSVRF
ncbi:hypothetical protein BhaS171_00003 [Bacillus phage vB_BhaS-171]|uniref:hypothetical protein n=1 Tax=Bacillus phage vB_BhaS-171 TaxID=1775140 RepID=UPI0007449FBE|nr:hypothetical protein BH781_gp03 [Bacillus phage vB_BhaS-171]ALY08059.1 hypothetical protein BhaS171_00003 [Bacillus phage vB_BhaS-171]